MQDLMSQYARPPTAGAQSNQPTLSSQKPPYVSQARSGSSVSFSNIINKYETQTRDAAEQIHPLRADPAKLTQPISIHLDHERDTMPVKNQKMFRNVASIEISELKDALAYAERLLAQNMEEKEGLMKKEAEHAFEIKRVEDRLRGADKARQNAESEVTQMNQKFKQMESNNQTMQSQVKDRLGSLQKEIDGRQQEIIRLNSSIETKETEASQAAISSQLNNDQRLQLETLLTRKDAEIKRLRTELDQTRRNLDTTVLTRKAEGTAQLQLEAYRQENARLLALLAKTPQYNQFASFAQDSGAGVRYMNATNPAEKAPSPNQTRQKPCQITYQADPNEGFGDENGDEWIPEEAYRVAHDFRNRCASNVSQALMNTLLSDLNKVWRTREKKQISRIKSDANREVQYLRREVAFKKPYQQVMHEQDVKRLKTELKDAQQALRENVAVIKQERDGPNFGLHLVDHTVKYTNEIQVERRRLQEENERLQQRVQHLESGRHM